MGATPEIGPYTMLRWAGLLLMLGLQGCALWGGSYFAPVAEAELLSAERFPGEVPAETGLDGEILAMDAAMQGFVRDVAAQSGFDRRPLQRLLTAMRGQGLLSLDYDSLETLTARETFARRRGNCLSYTNLIVALAREAGLDARYQLVEAPVVREQEDGVLLVYQHINALVRQPRGLRYEVDFNAEFAQGDYRREVVPDAYAHALYFVNRAVDALRHDDPGLSFRRLQAALETYPGTPGAWSNLGVLYARAGDEAAAETAYRKALKLDRNTLSARENLLSLYRRVGAEAQLARLQKYQPRLQDDDASSPLNGVSDSLLRRSSGWGGGL